MWLKSLVRAVLRVFLSTVLINTFQYVFRSAELWRKVELYRYT